MTQRSTKSNETIFLQSRQADKNKNGIIEYNEFIEWLQQPLVVEGKQQKPSGVTSFGRLLPWSQCDSGDSQNPRRVILNLSGQISSRPHTSFRPQKVAEEGRSPYQGNLGDGEIL